MRVLILTVLLLSGVMAQSGLQAIPEETANYVNENYPLPSNPALRFADFVQREDLAAAGNLTGAERIWRIVQVTDMQLVDDDAPPPMRVGPGDPVFTGANVSGGAERPHEEYSDEILHSMIDVINAHHQLDPFQFAIHTGDNIDNALENELMRYLDIIEGTNTTIGPISGLECLPDGQSTGLDDPSNDVVTNCTSLPTDLIPQIRGIAADLPWFTMYGNHDGLIQGNVNIGPGMQDTAARFGRYFLPQDEYLNMHFADMVPCNGGTPADDFGHGYGFAGDRLCDDNIDNDAYYAFDVGNVHIIVLDTVNDEVYQTNSNVQMLPGQSDTNYDIASGVSEGAMDALQFAWLQDELESSKDQLTMIFAHHTIEAFYSKHFDAACGPPGCLNDVLRQAGFIGREDVHQLLKEYPNMVAFIGGHTHKHQVKAAEYEGDDGPLYWNIETSGLLDTPQETRIIELWQSGDKFFLALDPIGHTFAKARNLAYSDTSRDHAAKHGTELDRRVLLWFDADVAPLQPMHQPPETGGFLTLSRLAPAATSPTGNHSLIVALNGTEGVAGLIVSAQPLVLAGEGALTVQEMMPMRDRMDGTYEVTVNLFAEGEFAYRIDAHDPTGTYRDQFWNTNFLVESNEVQGKSSGALAPFALIVAFIAFAFFARRRT